MTEDKNDKRIEGSGPGLAILGCLATGVIACICALMGVDKGQVAGAGVCLIAAALAFGVVVYVSFSD